ncbi:MAG: hypothetical protein FH758_01850 [Firmicutes bacterium]|nr:hypothetical protein [Bacillota bacterium]
MNLTNFTMVAQAFHLITIILFIIAICYVVYSITVKIPKRIEKNTQSNQELIRKHDYIIEQLKGKNIDEDDN